MNKKTFKTLEYDKIRKQLKKHAGSELGKAMVECLEPSIDYDVITRQLSETSEVHRVISEHGRFPIGKNIDMSGYLSRAALGGFLYPGELLEVSDTLRTARRVKQFLNKTGVNKKDVYLRQACSQLSEIITLEERINLSIMDESDLLDNASSTLSSIRRKIDRMNQDIRSKLNQIIKKSSNASMLQNDLVTMRDNRFVVPVKSEFKNSVKGIIHDRSSSGQTLYIEPIDVMNLNNDLQELQLKEVAEVHRILTEITEDVFLYEMEIKSNQETLTYLDFTLAKAKLSKEMNGIVPKINDNSKVKLINVRHPLIEADVIVPLSILLGENYTTLVITGPNTGGKTCALKVVGLMVLMTQSGLHIPAEIGSEMPVFTNVYADIGDEQSIEQSLSTFSSHMTNIVDIINHVDYNDLVLFDELGAGTDPVEGAALAMSILDELNEKKICTMATTHYSELKYYAHSKPGTENASMTFDVETLSPTYQMKIGVAGKSNAFKITKKLGLNDNIIKRAEGLIDKNTISLDDMLSDIHNIRGEIQVTVEEEAIIQEISHIEESPEIIEDVDILDDDSPAMTFDIGQLVMLKQYDQEGKILSIKGNELLVKAGIMKMTVNKEDVLTVQKKDKKIKVSCRSTSGSRSIIKALDLTIIGNDKMQYEFNKYIDEVLLNDMKSSKILYKTATRRKKLKLLLKKHPSVKSFVECNDNEGTLIFEVN